MKTLLTFFAIAACICSKGQSDFDERLLSKFSQERIVHLQEDHNAVIEYWSYYLDNSFLFLEESKAQGVKKEKEIKIKDLKNFNILDLDVRMDRKKNLYYSIKGTDQTLVMLSNEAFVKKFKRSRSQNNQVSQ